MGGLIGRCGGGGSFSPLQAVYNSSNVNVGSGGSFGDADWTYVDGDAVLDLSTPTQPVIPVTGLYIFNLTWFVNGGGTVGRTFQGNLQLDTAVPRNMVSEAVNPSGGFGISGHNSDAVVMTAGTTLRLRFVNNDSVAHNFNLNPAHVVFIPTS